MVAAVVHPIIPGDIPRDIPPPRNWLAEKVMAIVRPIFEFLRWLVTLPVRFFNYIFLRGLEERFVGVINPRMPTERELELIANSVEENLTAAEATVNSIRDGDTTWTVENFNEVLFIYQSTSELGNNNEKMRAVRLLGRLRGSCVPADDSDLAAISRHQQALSAFYPGDIRWATGTTDNSFEVFSLISRSAMRTYKVAKINAYLTGVGIAPVFTATQNVSLPFSAQLQGQLETFNIPFIPRSNQLEVPHEDFYAWIIATERKTTKIQKALNEIYRDPLPELPSDVELEEGGLYEDPLTGLYLDPNQGCCVDIFTREPLDLSWGITIAPTDFGTYKLSIPPELKTSKKLYSLFLLLKAAEKRLPADAVRTWITFNPEQIFDFLDNNGIGNIPQNIMEFVCQTLDARDRAADEFRDSLEALFPGIDFDVEPGTQPLSDLFQDSPDIDKPAVFQEKHGMTVECARMLQEEAGCVILPEAVQVQTPSTAIQDLLERKFRDLQMTGLAGQPLTFLEDTRDPGLTHLANLSIVQLKELKDSLQTLAHMLKIAKQGRDEDYLPTGEELLHAYKAHELRSIREHFSSTPIKPSAALMQGLERSFRAATTFEEVQQRKRVFLQDFFRESVVCPETIWTSRDIRVTEADIHRTVYARSSWLALGMSPKFQAVFEYIEASPVYQTLRDESVRIDKDTGAQDHYFDRAYAGLKTKVAHAIHMALGHGSGGYYGSDQVENTLYQLERVAYHLSNTERAQSPAARKALLKEFGLQSGHDGWEGCTQGLASRMQTLVYALLGCDETDPTLTYKRELMDFCWNVVMPDFQHETQIYKTRFETAVSEAIGMLSDSTHAERGNLRESVDAIQFIKGSLTSYDVFVGFYDNFLKELCAKEDANDDPSDLLCNRLEIDEAELRAEFFDEPLGQWDYFSLKEKLPLMVSAWLMQPNATGTPALIAKPLGYRPPAKGFLSRRFEAVMTANWRRVETEGVPYRDRGFRTFAAEEHSPWTGLIPPPAPARR